MDSFSRSWESVFLRQLALSCVGLSRRMALCPPSATSLPRLEGSPKISSPHQSVPCAVGVLPSTSMMPASRSFMMCLAGVGERGGGGKKRGENAYETKHA
jgi:hypothetical protein